MGIALDQYRATIGNWAAGKLKRISPSISAETDTSHGEPPVLDKPWTLSGPWKLHAVLIVMLLNVMCFSVLTPGYVTNSLPQYDLKIGPGAISNTDLMQNASNSISHQCLQSLLLIGGVEPNPGPVPPTQEDIIAQLASQAPTDIVRNCIRRYDPAHRNTQHRAVFSKCNKSDLTATLAYLKCPGKSSYTKPDCVKSLISRIQNFLPDACASCKQEYCIRLEDVPLLNCDMCGQGTHNECIFSHLGISESEQSSFTPEDALALVNPTGIPGVHYMCGACTDANIPEKEDGPVELRSSQDEPSHGPEIGPAAGDTSTVTPEVVADDEDGATSQHGSELDDHGDTAHTHDQSPVNNQQLGRLSSNSQQQYTLSNICRHYQRGTCKYGLVGRECPRDHPRACQKLLTHGNKGPNGCTQGRSCENYHPRMCTSSLRTRQCFKKDCKLRHVKGTARKQKEMPSQKEHLPQKENGNFLDALNALRAEMSNAFRHEINSLHQRLYATQTPSQMAQQQPAPAHPPTLANHYQHPPQMQMPTAPTWQGRSLMVQTPPMWHNQAMYAPGYAIPTVGNHPMMMGPTPGSH